MDSGERHSNENFTDWHAPDKLDAEQQTKPKPSSDSEKASKPLVHEQPDSKVLFDENEVKRLSVEDPKLFSRKPLVHEQPDSKVLFDTLPIAYRVYNGLKALNVDHATIQNALSGDLLDELEHDWSHTNKIQTIKNAIDKLIRKAEHTGKFTLDLYGDPQPIGALGKLWNSLRGGRKSQEFKKTHEYRTILSLQALRDAINTAPVDSIKYPVTKNFSGPVATNQTKTARTGRQQFGRWATGLATAGVISAAVSHQQGERVHTDSEESEPKSTYKMPDSPLTEESEYFKIVSSRTTEDTAEHAPRRNKIETNPSEPTTAVKQQSETPTAPTIVKIKPTRQAKIKSRPTNHPGTKTIEAPVIRPTKKTRNTVDTAKSKIAAERAEYAKTEAKRITKEMIPSHLLNDLTTAQFTPKARLEAAHEKAHADFVSEAKKALRKKFGANAERYFNALPPDVISILETAPHKRALAYINNRLINIHTDPDITAEIITALHTVLKALKLPR